MGQYEPADRISAGGAVEDEGENIEDFELGIDTGLVMIRTCEIWDGKIIMLLSMCSAPLLARLGS